MKWRELVLVESVERVGGPQCAGANQSRVQCIDENITGVAAVWLLWRKQFIILYYNTESQRWMKYSDQY